VFIKLFLFLNLDANLAKSLFLPLHVSLNVILYTMYISEIHNSVSSDNRSLYTVLWIHAFSVKLLWKDVYCEKSYRNKCEWNQI